VDDGDAPVGHWQENPMDAKQIYGTPMLSQADGLVTATRCGIVGEFEPVVPFQRRCPVGSFGFGL
jgi:hypothetical protein